MYEAEVREKIAECETLNLHLMEGVNYHKGIVKEWRKRKETYEVTKALVEHLEAQSDLPRTLLILVENTRNNLGTMHDALVNDDVINKSIRVIEERKAEQLKVSSKITELTALLPPPSSNAINIKAGAIQSGETMGVIG